jgi:hypothetical protein
MAFVLALPWLIGVAERLHRRSLQGVENVVTPLLIGALGLPLLPAAAVVGALLTGTAAQVGWRSLPSRFPAGCGRVERRDALLASRIVYSPDPIADVLCVVFVVLYTTLLCGLGYEQTMRIHRQRERIRRVRCNSRRSATILRGMSPPVAARLVSKGSNKAPLARLWLTVAFVDIIDFTALTERIAPEDLTALLDEFFAGLQRLPTHGGNLHKFLGDGALISFGDFAGRGRRTDACACVAAFSQLTKLDRRVERAAARAASRGRWACAAALRQVIVRLAISAPARGSNTR